MHVWFQRTRQHIVTVLQPKTRAKQHPKIQQWHLPCGNQNNTQRCPERQPYSNSRHLYNQDNTQNSTQMSNHNTPLQQSTQRSDRGTKQPKQHPKIQPPPLQQLTQHRNSRPGPNRGTKHPPLKQHPRPNRGTSTQAPKDPTVAPSTLTATKTAPTRHSSPSYQSRLSCFRNCRHAMARSSRMFANG